LSYINRRRGPWSCEDSIPQYRGMPDGEVVVGGWEGSTLIEAGGGGRMGYGVPEGKPGKAITFEI